MGRPGKFRLYGHDVCKRCLHGFANRRQAAYLVDIFVFGAIRIFVATLLMSISHFEPGPFFVAGIVTFYFNWPILFREVFSGYSPGKAVFGVRVLSEDTWEPVGFGRAVLRTLPILIPFVPLVIAFTMMRGKRIGDGWARTRVIWNRYRNHPIFVPTALTQVFD